MFEGDYADMCAAIFSLMSMGGRAEGLVCADPGASTPIGVDGIFYIHFQFCSMSDCSMNSTNENINYKDRSIVSDSGQIKAVTVKIPNFIPKIIN